MNDRISCIAVCLKNLPAGPWWVEQERPEQAGEKGYRALLLKYRWDDVPTWLAESSCHPKAAEVFSFLCDAPDNIDYLIKRLADVTDERDRWKRETDRLRIVANAAAEGGERVE